MNIVTLKRAKFSRCREGLPHKTCKHLDWTNRLHIQSPEGQECLVWCPMAREHVDPEETVLCDCHTRRE